MKAYNTIARANELRAWLADQGDEDPELLRGTIEGETDLYGLLDWAVARHLDESALVDAIKARQSDLGDRKKAAEARADKLRTLVRECMEAAGEKSYRAPDATISLRRVDPKPIVTDESLVPECYWRVSRDLDKSKINTDFKGGTEIPGVTLDNGGVSITIRAK